MIFYFTGTGNSLYIRKATFQTDYFYIVLTYGNIHANAVELANKVVLEAGKKAGYITTILMVDNFLPGFDMNKQMSIDKKVKEQIISIKADIQQKNVKCKRLR